MKLSDDQREEIGDIVPKLKRQPRRARIMSKSFPVDSMIAVKLLRLAESVEDTVRRLEEMHVHD